LYRAEDESCPLGLLTQLQWYKSCKQTQCYWTSAVLCGLGEYHNHHM